MQKELQVCRPVISFRRNLRETEIWDSKAEGDCVPQSAEPLKYANGHEVQRPITALHAPAIGQSA